jgi:hypothetical protein
MRTAGEFTERLLLYPKSFFFSFFLTDLILTEATFLSIWTNAQGFVANHRKTYDNLDDKEVN